jgi:TonB family protein
MVMATKTADARRKALLLCMMLAAGIGPAIAQQPEPAPQAAATQRSAAELFDGLRYDMLQSAAGTWSQLTPDVRRKFDALVLIMDDVTGSSPDRRAVFLKEFLSASAPLIEQLTGHPCRLGLLTLRTAALLELKRTEAARTAARQLLDEGAVYSEGVSVRRLMAILERKGWLVVSPEVLAKTPKNEEPVAVYRVAPAYPSAAQALNLDGRVRVKFTIAADGSVKDAKVAGGSCSVFDEAALTAVSQWRYKPARRNGVISETAGVSVVVSFRLEG